MPKTLTAAAPVTADLAPDSPPLLAQPDHAAAMAWAQAHFPARQVESVTHSGWASTYRLGGPRRCAYLKIVPPVQSAQLELVADLSRQFAGHVPRVLALNAARGWLLTEDHGGTVPSLDDEDDEEAIHAVLRSFASLQAQAARLPDFLARFKPVAVQAQLEEFLAFLDAPQTLAADGRVGAAYFVGEAAMLRYRRLFHSRAEQLRRHLQAAASLPATLAHGDLHAGNTAIGPNGQVCFIDWDEAAAGPAGLCLQGLFLGCAYPSVLLARMQSTGQDVDVKEGRRLAVYVDTLAEEGYATREQLLKALPGAMCAGLMRFITSFGRYPGERGRQAAAATVQARLSDLLDLCDWLDTRSPDTAAATLEAYTRDGEWRRGLRIAQDLVARQPSDPYALGRYAHMAYHNADLATAEEAWQEALQLAQTARRGTGSQQGPEAGPSDEQMARWHLGLAQTRLGRLDLTQARVHLRKANALAPDLPQWLELDARLRQFAQIQRRSARAKGWPQVPVSQAERDAGRLAPDTLALLVDQFTRYGAVQVDGIFDVAYIKQLQESFRKGYGEHFYDGDHASSLKVGDKRYMLTMRLDSEFGAPALVASPLLDFFHKVLGPECILSAYTAVISLPGSDDQKIHKDHCALFDEAGWQLPHPTFAAQIIVPLLQMDESTGATRVHKGSQRVPLKDSQQLPYQDPVVPLGSCVLLDYSVAHYGMGNRSDQVRPIINLVYSRPWFRDCRNYYLQPPLSFDAEYLARAPEAVQKLVSWWDVERKAALR